jgi:outer membrane protein assembly factor BamA
VKIPHRSILRVSTALLGLATVTTTHAALADEPATATAPASTPASQGVDGAEAKQLTPRNDGWPDISDFLDQKFGFLPIARPITEPAVGYGAAGGLMFISKPLGAAAQGLGRPNITGVGGFGTANGSWGLFAVDLRYWADDRVQTMFGAVYASVNLDYYGTGNDSVLHDHPLRYNLQPIGGAGMAKYRFGESRFWAGLGYAFASTKVSFDAPDSTPRLPDYERRSNVGLLLSLLTFDTRDNFFTPIRGTFVEGGLQLAAQWLGADDNFERLTLTTIQYLPLAHRFYFGLRGDFGASLGNTPFYLRPAISLRGVPAMRYQGQEIAQLEAELRWQFYGRWSLLGFAGGGDAWNHFERADNAQGVLAGGGGFRYELARRYGIHVGVDVAGSRDTAAFYIQVGSAWMRP